MTPKGRFITEQRPAIKRAAVAIERELNSRGLNVQTSTAFLVAIHACAAFANIPETPASEKLANIKRELSEHTSDCAVYGRDPPGKCDCGATP